MFQVGFEPITPALKRTKTVHALYRTDTVIGLAYITDTKWPSTNTRKVFCKHENYDCYYAISGYHSNEMWNVNTLHDRKLCRSLTSEQSFVSASRVYCVNI
jgi:hypothetical protein